MTAYKNSSGNSGVVAYQISDTGIVLQFRDGKRYLYNYSQTGRSEVEEMKRRAVTGDGLTTYVNKHVRSRYARKL